MFRLPRQVAEDFTSPQDGEYKALGRSGGER